MAEAEGHLRSLHRGDAETQGSSLRGATALITGGARRLGRHIALRLAREGAGVAISYHHSGGDAADTVRAARALGVRALAIQADASDPPQVDQMLAQVLATFSRLDVFIANAGAFRRTPLPEVSEADWDEMIRLNFQTALAPARRIGQHMRNNAGGCIVAIADVAGIRPWREYIPYSVAKSCVIALTEALAIELAPTVRVNAIAPGPILFPDDFDAAARQREINQTLLHRQGDPAQVAEAVVYLARNDYVTGTILPVDGGRLLA